MTGANLMELTENSWTAQRFIAKSGNLQLVFYME